MLGDLNGRAVKTNAGEYFRARSHLMTVCHSPQNGHPHSMLPSGVLSFPFLYAHVWCRILRARPMDLFHAVARGYHTSEQIEERRLE